MHTSMVAADVVGVLGLWRPNQISLQSFVENQSINIRGKVGQWRGIEYIKGCLESGELAGKKLVSAHCYFGIVKHLGHILNFTEKLFIISNNREVVEYIRDRYQRLEVIQITAKETKKPPTSCVPVFFEEIKAQIPDQMEGSLSLIGAGPWAELYCSWVKDRGGVAVDLGSGMELIVGEKTRPVHAHIQLDTP